MKQGFYQLPAEKRDKIVRACLAEFGAHDFERAALDRIVETAGISKGGLYEYISSKEELYLFIVDLSYSRLYEYLHGRLDKAGATLPEDILDRFGVVSRAAIDFYIEHPEMIGIIVKTSHLDDEALAERTRAIFDLHYSGIFDSAGSSRLAFPKERIVELLKWILVKTRNDFLKEISAGSDARTVFSKYIDEWDFMLSVLRQGIYTKP
jgi:TetR/AcrR family transcriptional regulator